MGSDQSYPVAWRVLGPVLVVIVIVLAGVFALTEGHVGSDNRYLYAGFKNTNQMTPGQQVRIAGRAVGSISSIKLDKQSGYAVVKLHITDSSVWPLPVGTTAIARWGSNTSYLGRYTELDVPTSAKHGMLNDGAVLSSQEDQSAFELDEAYNIFRGKTASQTQILLDRLGATLNTEGPSLQRGVKASPYGLDQAADLMTSLDSNEYDLKTLAQAGDRTLSTLNANDSQLQNLVSTAAGTMDTFASHVTAQQTALHRANPSLTTADSTFGRLDTSLGKLTTLVDNLRPGAPALTKLAKTTSATLVTLRKVAPVATATLNDGTAAAPQLSKLFDEANTVFPAATQALSSFTPMLACVRPYTPDITGFLTTWSGFTSHYDAGGHYGRSFELTVIPALQPGTKDTPAQAMAASPGLTYAYPRPPGMNEGHPYFLPQCGVTAASLNPADDQETSK